MAVPEDVTHRAADLAQRAAVLERLAEHREHVAPPRAVLWTYRGRCSATSWPRSFLNAFIRANKVAF
jgi:hypothetical protein